MSQRPENDSIVVECELAEAPEKVWRALTVPENVAGWLSPNNIKPEPGARFAVENVPSQTGRAECEVLAVEAPRMIRYSWRADGFGSTVTFQLTETDAGGTHLRLVHDNFYALQASLSGSLSTPVPQPALAPVRRMRRTASRAEVARRAYRPLRAAA